MANKSTSLRVTVPPASTFNAPTGHDDFTFVSHFHSTLFIRKLISFLFFPFFLPHENSHSLFIDRHEYKTVWNEKVVSKNIYLSSVDMKAGLFVRKTEIKDNSKQSRIRCFGTLNKNRITLKLWNERDFVWIESVT